MGRSPSLGLDSSLFCYLGIVTSFQLPRGTVSIRGCLKIQTMGMSLLLAEVKMEGTHRWGMHSAQWLRARAPNPGRLRSDI